MGCANSKGADPPLSAVDIELQEAELAERKHFKVLLLGAGESGKSTVIKQLKLVYKGKLPPSEAKTFGLALQRNTVTCMQTCLDAMTVVTGGTLTDEEDVAAAHRIRSVAEMDKEVLTEQIAQDVRRLWATEQVQAAYAKRDKFWILDAAAYYFEHCERFAAPGFEPNEEDLIMARVRTSGVLVTQLDEDPYKFSVVDVGGQQSERRKWIHCFDNVKAIVYLVNLGGYNKVLFEDYSMNRMHESLKLFEEVAKNELFKDTPFYVIFNKKDIFEQEIKHTPLNVCFPDYEGAPQDVHTAISHVEKQFIDAFKKHRPGKTLKTYVIAARVRLEMKMAWAELKDSIKAHYGYKMGASAKGPL
ncbi:unnamed protein product [Chrysoparadoxa australica]